jgi:hypothetical protein
MKSFPRPPFTTSQIVRYLKDSIEDLASTPHPETRLPGLVVRDQVFVDGTYVRKIPEALVDSPSSDVLEGIMAHPTEVARYHIGCQVQAWDGELVTTVYAHASLQGRTLYVEFSTYALTPTPPRFWVIDRVDGAGAGSAWLIVRRALSERPDLAHAPGRLVAAVKVLLHAFRAQRDTTAELGNRHNIGALVSAREIACDGAEDDDPVPSAYRRLFCCFRG